MSKALLPLLFLLSACSTDVKWPSFADWLKLQYGSYAALTDRNGVLIQETRVDFKQRRLGHHAFASFGPELVSELTKLEDQNFWKHAGVDYSAFASSAWQGLLHGHLRGASTISMQTANLLHPGLRKLDFYKLEQMRAAQSLERSWNKEQILEAYLNLVDLRGEIRGIPTASRILFGKPHAQLILPERLWLYGLIPSPSAPWEKIEARACRYGKRLDKTFDCQLLKTFRPEARPLVTAADAPHALAWLHLKGTTSTTLELGLQRKVRSILEQNVAQLRQQNVRDAAALVVERSTGAILAYVGGIQGEGSAFHVDHVQAQRQTGSTLKPLLYAQAIQERRLTMASPLLDAPFAIATEGLTYKPENHNRRFLNRAVPLKEALGSSLNIPAIRAIDLIGPTHFYDFLKRLGFKLPFPEEFYGHSLALGAADASLYTLTQAYLDLAQGESSPELHLTKTPPKFHQTVFTAETSSILTQILSEKSNRVHSFGLDSVLSTSSWSAVKTGTSKDMRDNWAIGFTDRYVVGVWVGNSSGSSMWNVMGITGAAPAWRSVVELLHAESPSLAAPPHPALVQRGEDFYLAGTEPLHSNLALPSRRVMRILTPTASAQFAYDPDIPAANQRIRLSASGLQQAQWRLNGTLLTAKEAEQGLSVERRGKYTLELLDEKGTAQDKISFYVKAGKI